jgi:CBS domain-containing protein
MGAVNSILKSKGPRIFSILPSDSVYHALEIMLEKDISALMVIENERLIGIFTERDYARKVILKGKRSKNLLVSEVMTKHITTITPESTIDDCMRLMTDKFIRHLPVLKNDIVLGIISIGDVVNYIIEDQKFIIKNLDQYIGGDMH